MKYSLRLNRIFSILFFVTFSALLVFIINFGYRNEGDSNTYKCTLFEHQCIIASFLLFIVVMFVIYYTYTRTLNRSMFLRSVDKRLYVPLTIVTVCAFMFVFQLAAGYLLACDPVTDVKILNGFSADFARSGNFNLVKTDYMDHYMIKYQNNFIILFILSALYRTSYLLSGSVSAYLPITLNAAAINASVLLTVFLSRKLFGDRKALLTLLLCVFFAPFYTYTAFYYTDSLSMPFLVGSVYLFVYAVKSEIPYKKYLFIILCGGLIFISFKLKGSIILLLIGILVYLFLKLKPKRAAIISLSLVMGFVMFGAVYNAGFNHSNIVSEGLSERYEYPYTHWLMIGLKGYGHYNQKDSEFTHSFSNKELKTKANLDKIKSRIKKFGGSGIIKHLGKKAIWTWEDGTYYISHHIENPLRTNFLHSVVLQHGKKHFVFYAYSCAFQLFIILMMIVSSFKAIRNPKPDFMTLFRIIVFGAFLFFLIWETRSRYLYNLTPLFLILAVDGLSYIGDNFIRLKKKGRRSANL